MTEREDQAYNDMVEDKQRELLLDAVEEGVSNCCGAPVVGDVCTHCQEHCDIEPLE